MNLCVGNGHVFLWAGDASEIPNGWACTCGLTTWEKPQSDVSAQQKMHPTLLESRRKMVTCPNCQTVFGAELLAPQSG